MRKYIPLISVLFLFLVLLSLWFYPRSSLVLSGVSLLISLALSIYTIYQTHNGTENARAKILKEVGVMVLTLIIILFLGGIVAVLTNYQVSMRWGEVAGVVSAIGASFLVGYLVRMGMMKLNK